MGSVVGQIFGGTSASGGGDTQESHQLNQYAGTDQANANTTFAWAQNTGATNTGVASNVAAQQQGIATADQGLGSGATAIGNDQSNIAASDVSLGNNNAAIAGQQLGIGTNQAAIAGQQQNLGTAQTGLAGTQTGYATSLNNAADVSQGNSVDAWNSYSSLFNPVNSQVASDAMNYDSPDQMANVRQAAAGNANEAFDTAIASNNANLTRMGVNPNSGRFADPNATSLARASAVAGAENTATTGRQNTAIGLRQGAAGFGQNIAGISLNQAGLSTNQRGAASGATSAASGAINSAVGANNAAVGANEAAAGANNYAVGANNAAVGANTAASGANAVGLAAINTGVNANTAAVNAGTSAVTNLNNTASTTGNIQGSPTQWAGAANGGEASAGNLSNNVYDTNIKANTGLVSGMLGGGSAASSGGLGEVLGALSDETLKEEIEESGDVLPGLRRLKVKSWKYKDGVADSGRHVGPMAQDVHREFGDRAAPGGRMLSFVSMHGLALKGIQELAAKVDRLAAGLSPRGA
jgi:hypothetical protein